LPQIAPNLWKVGLEFFWCREYENGRVEREFDLDTGQIHFWGSKTPTGLKRAGWLPMTPDLAAKIRACGEFGIPTQSPSVMIDLQPNDELIISKDCAVIRGYLVTCKACNATFRSFGEPDVCPTCGSKPGWKCDACGEIHDISICSRCHRRGRLIQPFIKRGISWEKVVYLLGIKDKFLLKFNSNGLIVEH